MGWDPLNDCLYAYTKTFGYNEVGCRTNAVLYLQVSITGQLVIFSTRARLFFFQSRPSAWLISAFFVAQLIATIFAVYVDFGAVATSGPIGWGWAAVVWVWSLVWYAPVDLVKIAASSLFHGNPWKSTTESRAMLHMALNGGASHLGANAGSRVAGNSKAFAARVSKHRG